ncbi:bifunctional ADP-dependent NAD(P)H-hydrate dehydratase/NAD(P)H-hydrate epimerase [Cardiobacterium hominis]|uniref:bifunctional ADP-dependent NAD(P)H-hydrate dehydratase/NAD(P)H-hydrate epimerase n=1 Tax=Cardiobacterium hominis TaxID=2718 RepID=UPI00065F84CD|nr:bifunctional ADP-dependent NAD(P)H-hydrate dehydratase/NAD(P)H-hydrate epimerase [Cardiobacterium hominis]
MHFPEQLPLASADDIRTLDRLTCERQNISALQLMARAASCCTAKLLELYPDNHHWTVVAGPGNNGGDGLVIARQLFMRGDSVQVYRPQNRPCGAEHDTNAARLERLLPTADLAAFTPPGRGVLIDALFGVGTNRPLAEPYASLVAAINRAPVPVVAIDLPSGLQAEQAPEADTAIVHATHTLCLGCPKAALLWAEHEPYVGTLYLLPIGLDRAALAEIPGARWLDPAWLRTQYRPRRRFAHKGDAGRLLLVAGSRGMTGAALMAAQAALRSGCGLLTAHLPAACTTAFHAQITEAMSDADPHPEHNSRLTRDIPADALLLGCGLGTHADTAALLHDLAERYHDRPMVWDADALNLLAADPALQKKLPPASVLTPHPGEFARLAGRKLTHDSERITAARELAARLQAVVVLKGKNSIISAANGDTLINPSGNAGMAKGGSGDVLAGIIAALLAQGYPPFTAAALGTWLHGLAADIALTHSHLTSLTASDLIAAIPAALQNTFPAPPIS